MTGTSGERNGHGRRELQPMPQDGVYPLEKFSMWLECPLESLMAQFAELGVPIVDGTADMAVLLAAIERRERDGG